MNTLLTALLQFFAGRWSYVYIGMAVLSTVYAWMLGIVEQVGLLVDTLDSVTAPAFAEAGITLSPFALANYVIPLDVGVTLFTAWLGFWIICVGVRIIKAWIPTIS